MSWSLVAGADTLRDQINKRWPKRDKRSDGAKGDDAHAARTSDHNPDRNGIVHAIDIDEDLRGSKNDNLWLADQIIAYARMRRAGYERLKYVIYEDRLASGTYPQHFWTWRFDDKLDHTMHMHISFTTKFEKDGNKFAIPILDRGESGIWDQYVPYYDVVVNAMASGAANKATWRLACRLKELGFYEGPVAPEGKQKYPRKAILAMQDYMGWQRVDYNEKIHKSIWKQDPQLSTDQP